VTDRHAAEAASSEPASRRPHFATPLEASEWTAIRAPFVIGPPPHIAGRISVLPMLTVGVHAALRRRHPEWVPEWGPYLDEQDELVRSLSSDGRRVLVHPCDQGYLHWCTESGRPAASEHNLLAFAEQDGAFQNGWYCDASVQLLGQTHRTLARLIGDGVWADPELQELVERVSDEVLARVTDTVERHGMLGIQARWMTGPDSFVLEDMFVPVQRPADGRLHATTVVQAQLLKSMAMLAALAGGAVAVVIPRADTDDYASMWARGWVLNNGSLIEIAEDTLHASFERDAAWLPAGLSPVYRGLRQAGG
jgi:hypothetical protein